MSERMLQGAAIAEAITTEIPGELTERELVLLYYGLIGALAGMLSARVGADVAVKLLENVTQSVALQAQAPAIEQRH